MAAPWEGPAGLEGDDEALLGEALLLRDETRPDEPDLLGAGEEEVHVAGARLLGQALQGQEHGRAPGQVVNGPHGDALVIALEVRQVQHHGPGERRSCVGGQAQAGHSLLRGAVGAVELAVEAFAAGGQELDRHRLREARLGHSAQGVDNEPIPVRFHRLKAGMVHVGHQGDGRLVRIPARAVDDDVAVGISLGCEAQRLDAPADRGRRARLPVGHGRVGAKVRQDLKGPLGQIAGGAHWCILRSN